MELHKIRGGNKEELEANHYNIGVGISLGNKWFSVKNTVALVKWSLQYTRKGVVIYVADSIHGINLEVRNRISPERALRLATTKGTEFLEAVEREIRTTFPATDIEKITYATWAEIIDEDYKEKVKFLYNLYDSNTEFAEAIKALVRNQVSKEKRKFSDEEVGRLGTYILEELPEAMCRIPMKGKECDAYTYPFDGELTALIEKIQKGEVFPQVRDAIFTTEPKVFLEVR